MLTIIKLLVTIQMALKALVLRNYKTDLNLFTMAMTINGLNFEDVNLNYNLLRFIIIL